MGIILEAAKAPEIKNVEYFWTSRFNKLKNIKINNKEIKKNDSKIYFGEVVIIDDLISILLIFFELDLKIFIKKFERKSDFISLKLSKIVFDILIKLEVEKFLI
tara:strand:- start:12 stop:323 length:312 start_codon:yes stop_codon:yes gene_type:complete